MESQNIKRTGNLFVISAPSGAGKTTLCRLLMDEIDTIRYSVSHTTRAPREGEAHGTDYYFVKKSEFEAMIEADDLVEWAEVHGNYYGTSVRFIKENTQAGLDILLDIDVQGAEQIVETYPDTITIFIMPPSMEILKERLKSRGTDSPDVIEKRINNARDEIGRKGFYRHVVVNDDLEEAKRELVAIFRNYR